MSNYELAVGQLANEIENLNLIKLKNAVSKLITEQIARNERCINGGTKMLGESVLCFLHQVATENLLVSPGSYRNQDVHLSRQGVLTFQPPPWQAVKRLMRQFFRDMASRWKRGDALDIAAFALWRIGWIHPFKDGNGRTAFAFSYACLCTNLGSLLPDCETVLDQLLGNPGQCDSALRLADESYRKSKDHLDLHTLKCLLDELLLCQMKATAKQEVLTKV